MPRRGFIGVDIGGSVMAAGVVTPEGEVVAQGQDPTHKRGPGTAVATLLDLVQRMHLAARAFGVTVEGIGIGVPGTVDAERGVIGRDVHYVPGLAGAPLAATIAAQSRLPVYVDNDVNVLALGEWTFGAGQGARFLVVLAIGTGVGGGIIQDGRLVRGEGGYGGELGHVPINFDGRACICGGQGCLKTYVSGTDIALIGTERLKRDVSAADVFRMADEGNPTCQEVVTEVCRALGAGLAVIVNGLNPERLIVTGGVAESLKPLELRIHHQLQRYAFARALDSTRIDIVPQSKQSTVRGGAALVQYETERRRVGAR
ncbi:MAG TPA: ROK family protein [Methylomirabilota bacterium]